MFSLHEIRTRILKIQAEYDVQGALRELGMLVNMKSTGADREGWYELVESALFIIYDAFSPHTVDDEMANALMERIRHDWERDRTAQEQAAMMTIATVLLPREPALMWLDDVARSEPDPELRRALQECSTSVGRGYVV